MFIMHAYYYIYSISHLFNSVNNLWLTIRWVTTVLVICEIESVCR